MIWQQRFPQPTSINVSPGVIASIPARQKSLWQRAERLSQQDHFPMICLTKRIRGATELIDHLDY
jgi:hypothetical protein